MKKLRNLFLSYIMAGVALVASAQQSAPTVPIDPAIRIGKLDNGLTYYIRHNEEPKERASFYIIQNVGAILEEDDQNGLAHFLEHMAFNGTQNFPGKGIINTLEKHGVAFGRNINAYTSLDETIYNLSDVPVTQVGLVDTCLLVLHDWSHYLLLTDNEIDLERGVISEEWRTRRNASFRMQKTIMPVMFKGSRYADRDIIGDLDIIKSFNYETLRKYYQQWYRTDLQAIAVVGDIDVDQVEAKIKSMFGSIPSLKDPSIRPAVEIPPHKDTYFVKASDPEATNYSVAVYYLLKGIAPEKKDLNYYRDQLAISLFNRILSDRIAELLQKGEPPFIQGAIMYGKFVRGYNRMFITVSAKPNKMDEALRAIYTEAVRLNRYGITPTELDRAKSNLLTQTENLWKQKDKISNDQYVDAISQHFLENEPLESMDAQWELTRQLLPSISADELSGKAKQWLNEENRVIVVTGPEGGNVKLLSETETLAIIDEIAKSAIKPYEDTKVASSLIDKELKGSPVISTRQLPEYNAVEWKLANNAKIIYRFADYQKDNVLFQAISPGGMSLYEPSQLPSAMLISEFTGNFGAGTFDATTLKKMLTGKNVNLRPQLSEINETFSGTSSPKDFETMLQLLYLKFQEPRFDKEAYEALKTRYVGLIANMAKNPQKIMSDSLQMILTCHSPRTKLVTPEFFNEVSLDKMEKIYRERFSDAGDFTFFVVGNIADSIAKPLVGKYIGSLTDLPSSEKWRDNNDQFPHGMTSREIKIPLETKKATVIMVFNEKMPWSPEDNMKMSVIRDVLNLRFTEEIREKEGGTYGVSVAAQNDKFPKEEKTLQLSFDTDTAKAEHLKPIIFKIIERIKSSGPTAEDLDKVVKNLLKDREQAKPNNSYWMNMLTSYYRYNLNLDKPENFENILKSLTVKDVQKFAKKFFKKADVVDLVFTPKK
jgi:zinc protease